MVSSRIMIPDRLDRRYFEIWPVCRHRRYAAIVGPTEGMQLSGNLAKSNHRASIDSSSAMRGSPVNLSQAYIIAKNWHLSPFGYVVVSSIGLEEKPNGTGFSILTPSLPWPP
jgi:hypothetical protein